MPERGDSRRREGRQMQDQEEMQAQNQETGVLPEQADQTPEEKCTPSRVHAEKVTEQGGHVRQEETVGT